MQQILARDHGTLVVIQQVRRVPLNVVHCEAVALVFEEVRIVVFYGSCRETLDVRSVHTKEMLEGGLIFDKKDTAGVVQSSIP